MALRLSGLAGFCTTLRRGYEGVPGLPICRFDKNTTCGGGVPVHAAVE